MCSPSRRSEGTFWTSTWKTSWIGPGKDDFAIVHAESCMWRQERRPGAQPHLPGWSCWLLILCWPWWSLVASTSVTVPSLPKLLSDALHWAVKRTQDDNGPKVQKAGGKAWPRTAITGADALALGTSTWTGPRPSLLRCPETTEYSKHQCLLTYRKPPKARQPNPSRSPNLIQICRNYVGTSDVQVRTSLWLGLNGHFWD